MQTELFTTSQDFDYSLLDSGDGCRLERFGYYHVVRPDPNVLWSRSNPSAWKKPAAEFLVEAGNRGWKFHEENVSDGWNIAWRDCRFHVKPTPFRHMGLFPEQAVNWRWLTEYISTSKKAGRVPKVLNLFAYTGAASVVAAKAGAQVCHVDASLGSIKWAQENAQLSGLSSTAVRWIADDVVKFLRREVRRENEYDLIIMDPPVFGRGPKGEIFRLEERLGELLELARQLLTHESSALLLNFYATSLYPESVVRLAESTLRGKGGELELASLCLAEELSGKMLPTGFFIRSCS